MAQTNAPKAVSQYPLPPAKYYRAGAAALSAPPAPPGENESYNMFGTLYTTNDRQPTLEESGRKRLYDTNAPPLAEVRRLNKELLQLFRKHVVALCQPLQPDSPPQPHQELVQAIEDSLVNMHYLINQMRPVQAAMDIKTLLDRQTAARKDMADKLKDSVKQAWDLIGEAAEKLAEPSVELSEQTRAL